MSAVGVGLCIVFIVLVQVLTFVVIGMTEFARAKWKPQAYMFVLSLVFCIGYIANGLLGALLTVVVVLAGWKYWLYPIYRRKVEDHFEDYVHRYDK